MIRTFIFALGVAAVASATAGLLHAEQPDAAKNAAPAAVDGAIPSKSAGEATLAGAIAPAPATPQAEALRKALSGLAAGDSDEERNERAALMSFYEARGYAPLWLRPEGGLTPMHRVDRGVQARQRMGARSARFSVARRNGARGICRYPRKDRCGRNRHFAGGPEIRPLCARWAHHQPCRTIELLSRPPAPTSSPKIDSRWHRRCRRARRLPARPEPGPSAIRAAPPEIFGPSRPR